MQKNFIPSINFNRTPVLLFLFFFFHNNAFANNFDCSQPEDAANECTIPNDFDIDVVASGNVTWSDLISDVSPDDVNTSIRISGDGIVTVEDSDVLLKSSDALLVLEGVEFIVNNGNVLLDESESRMILHETTFRVSGNFQLKEETFLCATNSLMEIGDEEIDGNFNEDGDDYTSANFQNDGGYRYLENVCLNVTQDYQLESSGDGTASGGGLDIWKNVCAEIGDAGNTNASDEDFGDKDGDDSGNFQNSNTMKIYDSEIVIANGNFQNESSSQLDLCNVGIKLNDGNLQNSGDLNGSNLILAVADEIQNDGSWSGDILNWYAGNTNKILSNAPSESSRNQINNLFGDCDCMPSSNTITPIPDTYKTYSFITILGSILPNDIDAEGDNIILTGVEDPNNPSIYVLDGTFATVPGVTSKGEAVSNAGVYQTRPDGTFRFRPAANFLGTVVLNYEICDDNPNVACGTTTITILVESFGAGFDLFGRSENNNSSITTQKNDFRNNRDLPIGVNELKLMPNPVRNNESLFVHVETLKKSTNIKMVNMMGEVVQVLNVESIGKQRLELDISSLPNGIYHIVVEGRRLAKKVIVLTE